MSIIINHCHILSSWFLWLLLYLIGELYIVLYHPSSGAISSQDFGSQDLGSSRTPALLWPKPSSWTWDTSSRICRSGAVGESGFEGKDSTSKLSVSMDVFEGNPSQDTIIFLRSNLFRLGKHIEKDGTWLTNLQVTPKFGWTLGEVIPQVSTSTFDWVSHPFLMPVLWCFVGCGQEISDAASAEYQVELAADAMEDESLPNKWHG